MLKSSLLCYASSYASCKSYIMLVLGSYLLNESTFDLKPMFAAVVEKVLLALM